MDTHLTDSAASEAALSPVTVPVAKPSGSPPPRGLEKWRRKSYNTAMAVMKPLADIVERTSRVSTEPVMRAEDFAWARPLEANWREIRSELESVLVYRDALPAFHEINGDATTIRNDDWKTFFFYGFGRRSDTNCQRCPRTAELIAGVPGVSTAFFSILGPGIHIPPHKGPWKGFIRYHLGLIVPDPMERCGIEVGGVKAYWREGQSLVFDDTFQHHVWNDTNSTRVVLFLDVVRPCRFPGSLINQLVIRIAGMTPFVQDSFRRHAAWEKKFAKIHG